jgi:hypothetical protein
VRTTIIEHITIWEIGKTCGNEFLDWVKKPSPLHTPKHMLRPGPATVMVRRAGPALTWDYMTKGGREFRGFPGNGLCEVFFYFAMPQGRFYPLQVVFFNNLGNSMLTVGYLSTGISTFIVFFTISPEELP